MKVDDLFILYQGNGFELLNMTSLEGSTINFVSRTAQNNGVVARVEAHEDTAPFDAGLITVALGGSVLSSFVQTRPFYTSFHIMVLCPKKKMGFNEKLYYCMCIQRNAYRYSYGRQANKTLREIDLPDSVPVWVNETIVMPLTSHIKETRLPIDPKDWKEFSMEELFVFRKGKRLTKEDIIDGQINFLGAISDNNGVRQRIQTDTFSEPNCITVNYNGSVGEAFYQSDPFWASDDVNILYPNGWKLNKYISMFLITVIKANKYRFSYGRKWTLEKMKETVIRLPVIQNTPNWNYMETYIKTLPYSDRI